MPKTQKTSFARNLHKFDVLIEDTSLVSEYFQVTNLPSLFSGGRNSFLLGGSYLLQNGSPIQMEILDALGGVVYSTVVRNHAESAGKLVSVEVYDSTPVGMGTVVVMGKAARYANGDPIPDEWQSTYNVRWTYRILIDSGKPNSSPIRFLSTPQASVSERFLKHTVTSSYVTIDAPITASLTPILFSGAPIGYGIEAISPVTFSKAHVGGTITGSLTIGGVTDELSLPITSILNNRFLYSKGSLIESSLGFIDSMVLRSGSYTQSIAGTTVGVTASVRLRYSVASTSAVSSDSSFARLRITNLNTVSGEINKLRVHVRPSQLNSEFEVVSDVPVVANELLVSSSALGDVPIGDFSLATNISQSWYADSLTANTGQTSAIYPLSGTAAYYSAPVSPSYALQITDDVLARSISAQVPVDGTRFAGPVSSSGYFIGTREPVNLVSTTEYTLTLDAFHRNVSASVILTGITPLVDIYICGDVVSDDPLGQRIARLTKLGWYQQEQYNFVPNLAGGGGDVSLRFVVHNGFWNFANVSLAPATSDSFSPDETTVLVPNSLHTNELLEYKIQYLDINNNSVGLETLTSPTFFSGSNVDLGTLL